MPSKKVDAVTGAAKSNSAIEREETARILRDIAKEVNDARRSAGKDTLSTAHAARLGLAMYRNPFRASPKK